jgi:MobA/VirD2-like, nuclease domain/Large polyvalent protein-associated domain 7
MKGMNRIKRGRGFRGLLDYLEGNKDGPALGRLIGGTMGGATPRELAAEFKASRQLRPDIEKPVWHNSLRMPAGEDISDEKWDQIARDYLTRMGFNLDKTQVCWWKHDDEAALHIVASRVQLNGGVYLGQNENLISTRVIQQLEHDHNLTLTKGPGYDPSTSKVRMPDTRKPGKNEVEKAIRTQSLPPRQRLQRLIDDALAGNPTAPQFVERLAAAGVAVRPNLASTGRLNGFSFELDGLAFKGSSLGKNYTWNNLQQRGMTYDQIRDAGKLDQHRTGKGPNPVATAGKNLAAADRHLAATRRAAGSLDQAAGVVAHRTTLRAVAAAAAAYQRAAERDRGQAAGIDCTETDLNRRQAYKAQLFEERYRTRVSSVLLSQLSFIKRQTDCTTLKLRGGGAIVDRGDKVLAGGRKIIDEEIKAMLELAKVKGWTTIKPTGSQAFKAKLTEAAMLRDIKVEGFQLSAERQRAVEIQLQRERMQRAADQPHYTPKPTPH